MISLVINKTAPILPYGVGPDRKSQIQNRFTPMETDPTELLDQFHPKILLRPGVHG